MGRCGVSFQTCPQTETLEIQTKAGAGMLDRRSDLLGQFVVMRRGNGELLRMRIELEFKPADVAAVGDSLARLALEFAVPNRLLAGGAFPRHEGTRCTCSCPRASVQNGT